MVARGFNLRRRVEESHVRVVQGAATWLSRVAYAPHDRSRAVSARAGAVSVAAPMRLRIARRHRGTTGKTAADTVERVTSLLTRVSELSPHLVATTLRRRQIRESCTNAETHQHFPTHHRFPPRSSRTAHVLSAGAFIEESKLSTTRSSSGSYNLVARYCDPLPRRPRRF